MLKYRFKNKKAVLDELSHNLPGHELEAFEALSVAFHGGHYDFQYHNHNYHLIWNGKSFEIDGE